MYNFLKNKYLLLLIMSNNINLTSVNQGTLWNFNNIKTIGGPPGNTLTISGNTSLSVMNLGTNIDVSGNLNANGNMILPNGTTANRPFGVQGYLRFNTTNSVPEYYNGNIWTSFTSTTISPIIPVISTRTINIASSSNPSGTNYTWNSSFTTQTLSFISSLIGTNNSTYAITATGGTCYALFTLLGAGGSGGYASGTGGAGGYTCAVVPLVPGVTYNLLVGQGGAPVPPGGSNPNVPIGGGGLTGTAGYGGQGGGFTGLFYGNIVPGSATLSSVTPGSNSNALLIAGGGGGAAYEGATGGAGAGKAGGAGGNGADQGGGGASWSGIGSTSASGGIGYGIPNPGVPAPGSLTGVILQGGGCANSGDQGGGGGGGGYYGGGGGSGTNPGSAGGGGCGYIASYLFSPTSSSGFGSTGGTGNASGTNGVAYISYYS